MPGSSRSIRAGKAFVEIYAERNPLERGLDRAHKSVKNFVEKSNRSLRKLDGGFRRIGKALAGVGAIAGAGGVLALNEAVNSIENLDKVNKLSKAFGLSAEAATGLFGVFKAQGSDAASSMESLVTLASRVKQAMTGEGLGAELFEGLSVSAEQLSKMNPEKQFFALHEAIMALEDPAERVNKLMLAFGEDGGKTLIGTLSKSTEALKDQAKGLQMSQAELDKATAAQMALNKMSASFQQVWNDIAVAIAPMVEKVSAAISGLVKDFNFQDAVAIAWQDIQLIFAEGMAYIQTKMINIQTAIADAFITMGGTIENVFSDIHDIIAYAINGSLDGLEKLLKLHKKVGEGTFNPLQYHPLYQAVATGRDEALEFLDGNRVDKAERVDVGAVRDANHDIADQRLKGVQDDLEKARADYMDAVSAIGDNTEAILKGPADDPRPVEGEKKPSPLMADPMVDNIVGQSRSAVNSAAIVGTSGAAQAIARAMSRSDEVKYLKEHSKYLKDLIKTVKKNGGDSLSVEVG